MMVFYTHTLTPRIQYIIDFFAARLFNNPIEIVTNPDVYKASQSPKINYSDTSLSHDEFVIHPVELLFQKSVNQVKIDCQIINDHKAFFFTSGDFPFDIFAASFYLLSRYEEYLNHEKDIFGRFDHTQSLAYQENFLNTPVIECWILAFKESLIKRFPSLTFKTVVPESLLTYDIDMAYSYRDKGLVKTIGGISRSIVDKDLSNLWDRFKVLAGKAKDPYDCYEWLDSLHTRYTIRPYMFFLVAAKQKGYDKNIQRNSLLMKELISHYSIRSNIGIHPSWQSGDNNNLLQEEKTWLEKECSVKITRSRQHFIRFTLPETYRNLIAAGIKEDFSMGYGTVNGFRASVSAPFFWYDLAGENATNLLIYPFCYMDANSYFELKHTPEEAYRELVSLWESIRKVNGVFVSIWHNNILSSAHEFSGWRQLLMKFLEMVHRKNNNQN